MPKPGEYFASPALEGLIQTDPVVAALFQDLDQVGVISRSGLVQPHQLRAVIGTSQRSGLREVKGFGATQVSISADQHALSTSIILLLAAMIWLPGIAFLVLITRVGAASRREQTRLLGTMGVSNRRLLLAHIMAVYPLVVMAAATGSVLYALLIRKVTRIPGTPFGFFSVDAMITPWHHVSVDVCITVIVTGFALTSMSVGRKSLPIRLPATAHWVGRVGLVVLAIGLLYLLALPLLVRVMGDAAVYGIWPSFAASALGLVFAGPKLIAVTLSALAPRVRKGGSLVGLSIPSVSSRGTVTLGATVVVSVVLILGSLSFLAVLNGGTSEEWNKKIEARKYLPTRVVDLSGGLTYQQVSSDTNGPFVESADVHVSGAHLSLVYANCVDLVTITSVRSADDCGTGPQWLQTGSKVPLPLASEMVRLPGLGPVELPSRNSVIYVPNLPTELNGALLLPGVAASGITGGATFFILIPSQDFELTVARLSDASPVVQVSNPIASWYNPDRSPFHGQILWVSIGSAISLAVTALAILASAIGETRERGIRLRPLQMLGANNIEMWRAHMWSVGGPLILSGWMAVLLGLAGCFGLHAFDHRASIPLTAALVIAIAIPLGALGISAATFPDTLRASRRNF